MLHFALLDQCDADGRADCRAAMLRPSMLIGKARRVFIPERLNGAQDLFMIFQSLESDSSSMSISYSEKLRSLDKLFDQECEILPGIEAANEKLLNAARFGERPSWKDCGQFVRIALQLCSTTVRFKFLEYSVPQSAANPSWL